MTKKNKQVRLEKQEDFDMLGFLNQDIIFKIKFYIILILGMLLFFGICFLVQHETYGFINW